jgi:hypothetical protein
MPPANIKRTDRDKTFSDIICLESLLSLGRHGLRADSQIVFIDLVHPFGMELLFATGQ